MKQLLRCVSLKGSNLCLLKMAHIHEKCTRSLALASFDSNINSSEALNGIRYIISISSFLGGAYKGKPLKIPSLKTLKTVAVLRV